MSNFVPINESIDVVGSYSNKRPFRPTKFRWRDKVFSISQITLTSNTKDGEIRKRLYSVVANNTLYRLEFTLDSEHWLLLEIWNE